MMTRHRKGFTLIELLTVVSIIGILAVIVVPSIRGATDRAVATALLQRVRVVRLAVAGEVNLEPDSVNAPAGTVPAPLHGALADSVMHGESGITFQLSGTGREIWLTLHAPDAGRGSLVLESAYAEAQREGLAAIYQGPVLQIALNGAAAATVPADPAAAAAAAGSATAPAVAAAQPATTQPADAPPTNYDPPSGVDGRAWYGAIGVHTCDDFARLNIEIWHFGVDGTIGACFGGALGLFF